MSFWADELAEKVIEKNPNVEKYVCASGITPSGIIHIGHLREVLTSEFVMRALQDQGKNAELIWSWDDYDRLRKIPKNVSSEFEKYLGMPISDVPDPFSCHESYARHFEEELEKSLPTLGIKARIIRQSEMYKKNAYFENIKLAMQKRKEIAKILFSYKAQGTNEGDIENYYPLNVYCSKCNKDTTKIISYDEENEVTYRCACGHEQIADLSKKNIGKLAWRVDWPLRWKYEGVLFEPAGRDHMSAGSSVEVSSRLAKEVFDFEPPMFQGYEWIGIQGGTHKMSSSTGEAFTPEMLLEIYEPEIARWFYARVRPTAKFDFALDDQIFRNYSEWDDLIKNLEDNKTGEKDKRMLDFCQVTENANFAHGSTSFRQLASFAQLTKGNIEMLKVAIKESGEELSQRDIEVRLPRALSWTEKYAPEEYRIKLRDTANKQYFESLDERQKLLIKKLADSLSSNWSQEALTNLLYEIPKESGLDEKETKVHQREFFKNLYYLLFDKEKGPRLPSFFISVGKDKIKQLLSF